MSINKILSVILWALMAISVVLIGFYFFGEKIEGTTEPAITGTILSWSIALLAVSAIAAIIFPVVFMITNPKNAKKTVFSIIILVVIFVLSYMVSSGELLIIQGYSGTGNNPITLKWTDTGLYSMYILLGFAIIAIIYAEVNKFFK